MSLTEGDLSYTQDNTANQQGSEQKPVTQDTFLYHECDCPPLNVRRYVNHRGQKMEHLEGTSRVRGLGNVKSYRQRNEELEQALQASAAANSKHDAERLQDWTLREDLAELDALDDLHVEAASGTPASSRIHLLTTDYTSSKSPINFATLPTYSVINTADEFFPNNGNNSNGAASNLLLAENVHAQRQVQADFTFGTNSLLRPSSQQQQTEQNFGVNSFVLTNNDNNSYGKASSLAFPENAHAQSQVLTDNTPFSFRMNSGATSSPQPEHNFGVNSFVLANNANNSYGTASNLAHAQRQVQADFTDSAPFSHRINSGASSHQMQTENFGVNSFALANNRQSYITSSAGTKHFFCENCQVLKDKIVRLEEENLVLKNQNSASLKIIQAINDDNMQSIEQAILEENVLLRDHVKSLTGKLNSPSRTTYEQVKDKVVQLTQNCKNKLESQMQITESQTKRLAETLDRERLTVAEQVSDTEAKLISENIKLKSKVDELTHSILLLEIRLEQSLLKTNELREKNENLMSNQLEMTGVFPDLDAEQVAMLENNWCNLSEAVTEKLDPGLDIFERLKYEENLDTKDEVIQCLWYRYSASTKALSLLQQKLNSIGIDNPNALEELSKIEDLVCKREDNTNKLETELEAAKVNIQKSGFMFKEELENNLRKNSFQEVKIKRLEEEIESLQHKLNHLLKQNHGSDVQENLNQVLQSLEKIETEKQDQVAKETNQLAELPRTLAKQKYSKKDENIKIQELEQSLEVYKNKVILLSEEKAKLERDFQNTKDRDNLKFERDSIASNFDNIDRRWNEEKQKNEMLTVELTKVKKQAEQLQELQIRCKIIEDDRNELKANLANFTNQLKTTYDNHQDKITDKENKIQQLTKNNSELSSEIARLKLAYETEKHQSVTEIQSAANLQIENLKKELDLLQRRASAFEQEKEYLLEQVKLMGMEIKKKENAVKEIYEKCSDTIETIKDNQRAHGTNMYTDPNLRDTKEALEDLGLLLRNKHLEFTETKQALGDLEKDTMSRFSKQYDNNSLIPDDVTSIKLSQITLQSELRTMRDQNKNLKTLLENSKESNAELREKLKTFGNQSSGEFTEMRQAIHQLTQKYEKEKQKNDQIEKQKDDLEMNLENCKFELKELKKAKTELEKLKAKFNEVSTSYDIQKDLTKELKERNNNLEARLDNSLATQKSAEDTLRQLQSKCSDLLKDNEELEKISSIGDDKANTLINIVEKLKNKIDNLSLAKKTLTHEKQSLMSKLRKTEDDWAESQKVSQTQITQLRNMLDQVKKDLKTKTSSLTKCEAAKADLELKLASLNNEVARLTDKLKMENESNKNLTDSLHQSELRSRELQLKLGMFEEAEKKEPRREIVKKLDEANSKIQSLQVSVKEQDQQWKAKEKQMIDKQRQKLVDLDSTLSQERSQHSITKSKCVSLDDEVDFLRSQLASYRKRELKANNLSKSHDQEVNDLIMKSQSKAHHVLLSNPDLVRSFTSDGRILASPAYSERISPTGSYHRLNFD